MSQNTAMDHVAFSQNGSWSMLGIAKAPFQVSISVLSRYCAGGVNPYTSEVAKLFCRQFNLAPQGKRNVETALSNLKSIGSLGSVLYFGFGVEHLVRLLAQTEEGTLCLAICAALRECYHEELAIEVLLEMTRRSDVPGQFIPSNREWKALLEACAGSLSTSHFPQRAETLMRICSPEDRLPTSTLLDGFPTHSRTCSSPRSVAEVLIAISKVTREELHSITITGGADVGWLAALTEFLFALRVRIHNSEGLLYENFESEEDPHLQILVDGVSHPRSVTEMQFREKVFRLENARDLIAKENIDPRAYVVSGRVPWNTALSATFLAEVRSIFKLQDITSSIFGSAARYLKALSDSDERIPLGSRKNHGTYSLESSGVGFVWNTVKWFPELAGLADKMAKASQVSLEQAIQRYESSLSMLATNCGCHYCETPKPVTLSDDGGDDGIYGNDFPDSDSDEGYKYESDKYCLVAVVETIITLSQILANVVVETSLCPMRSGLMYAYERRLDLRRSAQRHRVELQDLGPFIYARARSTGFMIADALEIFTGMRSNHEPGNISATSLNGICAYKGSLISLSLAPEDTGKIYILPGRIELDHKTYATLEDYPMKERGRSESETIRTIYDECETWQSIELRVKERASSLQCLLELRTTKSQLQGTGYTAPSVLSYLPDGKQDNRTLTIGPSELANRLWEMRGVVSCRRDSRYCKRVVEADKILQVSKRVSTLKIHNLDITFLYAADPTDGAAAIAACARLEDLAITMLVDRQCIQCCVRAALAVYRQDCDQYCFIVLRENNHSGTDPLQL